MKKFSIHPLHLGTIRRDKSNMTYMKDVGKKFDFPIIAWYLSNDEASLLVDTGGTAPDGINYMPYTRPEEQSLENALSKIGVNPDNITTVILTHLHWDHAGNNHLFRNAKFYVQKNELQYAVVPLDIHKSAYNSIIFNTKYEILDGDCEIMKGISVILTPGHSPGSQSIIVDTDTGKYIIAGDSIGLYECYESNPMIANGVHTDLISYYQSLKKIKDLGHKILPGHDPKVFQHDKYPHA